MKLSNIFFTLVQLVSCRDISLRITSGLWPSGRISTGNEPVSHIIGELMRSSRDSIGQNRLGNNIFLRHNVGPRPKQSIIDQILKTLQARKLTKAQAGHIRRMLREMDR